MTDSTISVTHGIPYARDSVTLYISPDLYEDLMAELESRAIEAQRVMQFSAEAVAAVIVIVGFLNANGFGQIAQVIESIAHRDDGKSIRTKVGDDEFEVTGGTFEKMFAQLPKLQASNADEEAKLDEMKVVSTDDEDS